MKQAPRQKVLPEKKTFYSDGEMDTLGRNKHVCIYKKKKTKLNEEFSNSTVVGNFNIIVSCVNVVMCAHVCAAVPVPMHAEARGQHQLSCPVRALSVLPLRQDLSVNVELGWLVWQPVILLSLPGRMTVARWRVCHLAWLLHGCWYQDSGPHA